MSLVVAGLLLLAQEQVRQDQYAYKVPVGYERFESGKPQIVGAHRRALDEKRTRFMGFTVEMLPGTIGMRTTADQLREDAARKLPAGTFQVLTMPWKGFEVLAIEIESSPEGLEKGVTYSVQVPLKPRAMQIRFMAPADRKEEALAEFRKVLAGVDGKTNWMSPGRFALVIALAVVYGLGWLLLLTYGVVKAIAWRGNPDRAARLRAGWLGVSAVLLMLGAMVGWATESSGGAENGAPLIGIVIAFVVANNASKLWKRGPSTIPAPMPPA